MCNGSLSRLATALLLIGGFSSASGASGPPASTSAQLSGIDVQRESLNRQRESLLQQSGVPTESTLAGDPDLLPPAPSGQADCPALGTDDVESLIAAASKKQSLPRDLLRAVIRQESAFRPCSISVKGAQGLMQLMPGTAAQLHVTDPFDPEQNVQAGTTYLKQLLHRYNGDLRLALVAYNAGATRADNLDALQYPLETQAYLANIFAELGKEATAEPVTAGETPFKPED